jgi:hypothetical protein
MRPKLFAIVFFILSSSAPYARNPTLSFFNEMEGKDVKALFADTTLIPTLQQLHAQIRIGMVDLTPERAEVVRQLNKAGIPVIAWLLLPKSEGYWFNSRNGDYAIERYKQVKKWADENDLVFKGIGLDMELDYNDVVLLKDHRWKLVGKLISRLYDKASVTVGKEKYQLLINTIRKDGYPVESYYVPFIKFEAQSGRTSLERLTGFLDITTDKDIPMLYSSFMGNAYGMMKVLAIDDHLKYVGIGSTGGGFDTTLPTMTWSDLARDLRLAALTADEIHIFSLEGTLHKGYLKKLIGFDYNIPVIPQPEQVRKIESLKSTVATISTILSYPTLFLLIVLIIFLLVVWGVYRLVKFVIRKISLSVRS